LVDTYGSVDVLEARRDTLADVLDFALVLGVVDSKGVQNENLSPFSALVQSGEQLGNGGWIQVKESSTGIVIVDLRKSSNGVGDDHWIGIRKEFLKGLDEALKSTE
jgi:hypothetical protein